MKAQNRKISFPFPFGKIRLKVRSLSCERVLDKLKAEGIEVESAKMSAKNEITFVVSSKERKKVFAILEGSCYNIVGEKSVGGLKLLSLCKKNACLLLGCLLFLGCVRFFQGRVLKIEVVGSGAHFENEVLSVLKEEGITLLSKPPQNPSSISSKLLSFPEVSYCSLHAEGGILTVEIQTSEETKKNVSPLLSPETGNIEELCVLSGIAQAKAGDFVEKGQTLVLPESDEIVIAYVKISFKFDEVFQGSEEGARAYVFLKYGETKELNIEKTDSGVRVFGVALKEGRAGI